MRNVLRVIGITLLLCLLFFLSKDRILKSDIQNELGIIFPSTQEDSDCAILFQNEECIMIDTGSKEDYRAIVECLNSYNIKKIKYLILTHPDQDHIGNAEEILKSYSVETVIQPYYPYENKQLEDVMTQISKQKIQNIIPTRNRHFTFHDSEIIIYPPLEKKYQDDNNYSLVTLIDHGTNVLLFTGDIQKKRLMEIEEINWGKIALLKVPYHGRYSENIEFFLKKLHAEIAVIPSMTADQAVIDGLSDADLYYTVGKTHEFRSTGKNIVEIRSSFSD